MGGELSAVHVGHVDVREEEVDGTRVLPAELQGMVGVMPLQYPVPSYCEDVVEEPLEEGLIIDDEDSRSL